MHSESAKKSVTFAKKEQHGQRSSKKNAHGWVSDSNHLSQRSQTSSATPTLNSFTPIPSSSTNSRILYIYLSTILIFIVLLITYEQLILDIYSQSGALSTKQSSQLILRVDYPWPESVIDVKSLQHLRLHLNHCMCSNTRCDAPATALHESLNATFLLNFTVYGHVYYNKYVDKKSCSLEIVRTVALCDGEVNEDVAT